MTTKEQLDEFYQFASDRMSQGDADVSMDELYSVWRSNHPTAKELSESISAINEVYGQLLSGDRGEPARESLRETCRELGIEFNP